MSLHSNAHDKCERSDDAARRGRSDVRDREGAMVTDVTSEAEEVEIERRGCNSREGRGVQDGDGTSAV